MTESNMLPATVEPARQSIVRAAVGDVTDAVREYQRIQAALDKALPDCIMDIRGRQFRKKNYWRAVATAFNLSVEVRNEQRDVADSDWGYIVSCRATAPNGRYADGDGACFASEKASGQDTLHNVRGHAHTRAYNRAVSNLVGFGEVSAEEMQHTEARRPAQTPVSRPARAAETISEPQRKRMWAIWSKRFAQVCEGGSAESKEANLREILGLFGYEHTADVLRGEYDKLIETLEGWLPREAIDLPPLPAEGEF